MASGTQKEEEYFPVKLFRMVEDEDFSEIIWWNKDCDGFFICEDQKKFLTSNILEKYKFKTTKYGSFIKQLSNYGFHVRRRPNQEKANERLSCYCHDNGYFKRGCPDLLGKITLTKGNQGTKKETSSKNETGQKLNQQGINQDLSQETETDASLENVPIGSFPGIHGGISEVYPDLKEGTSASSQTQTWCSSPSVPAVPSHYSFSLAKNISATPTIPRRETVHHFMVNSEAVSRVGQSNGFPVGQMQSFRDTTPTQTSDSIMEMFTQSDQYISDELMCDAGGEATSEQTILRIIPTARFSESTLLPSTTNTLAPLVGGFDTSPFQSEGVPVQIMQQVPTGNSLPESLHEAGPREQQLSDQYLLQDQDFPLSLFMTPLQNEVGVATCEGSETFDAGYPSEESSMQLHVTREPFKAHGNAYWSGEGGSCSSKKIKFDATMDPESCPPEAHGNAYWFDEGGSCSSKKQTFDATMDPESCPPEAHGSAYSSGEGGSCTSKKQAFNVTINPESCPPEGGKCFMLEFDESLSPSVTSAWAAFGPYGRVKVQRAYDEDCAMFGKKIPAGRPGPVTVTVTREGGECLGETIFTYEDTEKNKRKCALFDDVVKKLKQIEQGDDGKESRKSAFQQGLLDQAKQLDPDNILKVLVYAAAEAGAMRIIQTIFSLPAGRIAFEAYKEDSSLPEDIAEENGHGKVAAYLRDITRRYSEEQSTTPDQSRAIDLLELVKAFDELELNQSEPSSDKEFNQIREDDITETGYFADGETFFSGSETEICDFDDGLHKTSTCQGWSTKLATQRVANISSVTEFHKIDTSTRVRKTVANPAPTIKKKMNNALRRRSRKIKNALRRQERMTTNHHAS